MSSGSDVPTAMPEMWRSPRALTSLLDILSCRLPFAAEGQLARVFFPHHASPERALKRWLALPAHASLFRSFTLVSRPVLPLRAPLAAWAPGEPVPPLGAVAYTLQTRARGPLGTVRCLAAKCHKLPRASDYQHHLHLAECFLHLLAHEPASVVQTWRLDHDYARERKENWGLPLPDAVLTRAGKTVLIEIGGSSYERQKLERLHDYAEALGVAYEIW